MEVTDPVCGMRFDASKAAVTSEYGGTTYYFCGAGCKEAFDEAPKQYVEVVSEDVAGSGE